MYAIGDLVLVKDEEKCIYCIKDIYNENNKVYCLLKGLNHRIKKTVEMSKISKASEEDIKAEEKILEKYYFGITSRKQRIKNQKYLLGKILHIDGDQDYLNKCLDLYEELGLYCYGVCLSEEKVKEKIGEYLDKVNPDIVVITGHDIYNNQGVKDLNNYKNTIHFIDCVKEIKKKNNYCVCIAGACQSNFEALIACGASFASSPKRINIHTFDPAIIAIKVATTSFTMLVEIEDILKYIENGRDAFGGVQTYGKMRLML